MGYTRLAGFVLMRAVQGLPHEKSVINSSILHGVLTSFVGIRVNIR